MRTVRRAAIYGVVLGVAVLGGWWASRAAATSRDARPDARSDAPPVASASRDDDGFHKLLEEVRRRSVELDRREREVTEMGRVECRAEDADAGAGLASHAPGPGRGRRT